MADENTALPPQEYKTWAQETFYKINEYITDSKTWTAGENDINKT